ncbi:MinD/ParA family protein [Kitasatospora herbaricolor]|uniref:MinD/ParA family protein n=1 Tax=Kitasatospora herbaricolor TaxID=68217 RepID=A0ABZ1W0S8_9ACTN|nr:MinD/ParA family protein [Kitasatospora herbaricolor]
MAAEESTSVVQVRRLTEGPDWDLAPDYTPDHTPLGRPGAAPPTAGPAAGPAVGPTGAGAPASGGEAAPRPTWSLPLDAMGTVLVPPEARPGETGADPAPATAPTAPAAPGGPAPGLVPPAPEPVPPTQLQPPAETRMPAPAPTPPLPPAPARVALPGVVPPTVPPVVLPTGPAAPVTGQALLTGPALVSGSVAMASPVSVASPVRPEPGGAPRPAPQRGLRKRALSFGQGQKERLRAESAIRTPLLRSFRIAVVSLKDGVGKTSTTMALGSVLAEARNDKIIALDADPNAGTLGRRVRPQTTATVRDLLAAAPSITGYMDVRRFTSQAPSGLEVLAGGPGPAGAAGFDGFDGEAYHRVIELLGNQFPVVLSDTGTGLTQDSMRGVLDLADQLVVAATTSVDGASSASSTLEWLGAHGYGELARRSVTVVSGIRGPGRLVGEADLVAHFGARCRAVVVVPFDEHLSTGGEFDLAKLRPRTRRAYLDLAAAVSGGMAVTQPGADHRPAALPPDRSHPAPVRRPSALDRV